ncbi:MAG: AbrB/MazE/SpoVT family DNA-binding domain-containing protein [Nanoarchaeota archaeon]|nr:AbrB/MazE/SpoVT family DNA-binding domain-containing protein [Nanoarchaeota archaeon]
MEIRIIKVSDKGQVAIPRSVQERLGIVKGDEFFLFEVDGKILLEKTNRIAQKVEDDFKDILQFNEDSLKEVWDNKEDDIWVDYLRK